MSTYRARSNNIRIASTRIAWLSTTLDFPLIVLKVGGVANSQSVGRGNRYTSSTPTQYCADGFTGCCGRGPLRTIPLHADC